MRRLILTGVTALVVVLAGSFFINQAQAAPLDLNGYGWSSNIGWINFNPDGITGGSGVVLSDPTTNPNYRHFNGYAWSNNIGWIKFDPNLTGYNLTGANGAYLDTSTNLVSGWARACSILLLNCSGTAMIADNLRGGWDGWIKFGGVAGGAQDVRINLATGIGSGKAWGSDVIGWIDFDRLRVGPTGGGQPAIVTLAADSPINSGDTSILTWSSTNATNCRATAGPWSGNKTTSGSEESVPLTSNTTFSITCDSATPGGSPATASATVVVGTCTGGCCSGNCPNDRNLTLNIYGDTTARGGAQPEGLTPNCTLLAGQNQRTCTYPDIKNSTDIEINAEFNNPNNSSNITWGSVPSGSVGCQKALGVSGQSLTSSCVVTMSADRTIDVYLNDDDDDDNGGEFTVDYDTITRYIKATGVNVGGPNDTLDYFASTRAKLRFSNNSNAQGALSFDVGRLGIIANGNNCDVPIGYFGTGASSNTSIPSGTINKEFRVRFSDRCPTANDSSRASCFTTTSSSQCTPSNEDFGGGNYPVRVIVDWTSSDGTTNTKAITIPLQYTESSTYQQ